MNNQPSWQYLDATGTERTGTYVSHSDRGGTDITYFFRRDDGTLDLVSGSRLKAAKRIWTTTDTEET